MASRNFHRYIQRLMDEAPIDAVDPIDTGKGLIRPQEINDRDPLKREQRRKFLQGWMGLESNRANFNRRPILSGGGEDLLQQSIQGGLISQPLLSRGKLG